MVARPRGRAPQYRKAPHRPRRRCRQAPAHRPFAQRPGGHRHPPLPARCHRRHPRPDQGLPLGAGRSGRERSGDADARLHPPAGRPAGDLRPPHAGLFRNVRPRCRALRRCPQAHQPPAARRRRAGRHDLPDRPRIRRRTTRLRRRLRKLARCRFRPRLRHRIHRRLRAADDAHQPPVGRTGHVDEPARRLHPDRRPLLHRLVDHAAEEESGRTRTGARQDRPRLWPADEPA